MSPETWGKGHCKGEYLTANFSSGRWSENRIHQGGVQHMIQGLRSIHWNNSNWHPLGRSGATLEWTQEMSSVPAVIWESAWLHVVHIRYLSFLYHYSKTSWTVQRTIPWTQHWTGTCELMSSVRRSTSSSAPNKRSLRRTLTSVCMSVCAQGIYSADAFTRCNLSTNWVNYKRSIIQFVMILYVIEMHVWIGDGRPYSNISKSAIIHNVYFNLVSMAAPAFFSCLMRRQYDLCFLQREYRLQMPHIKWWIHISHIFWLVSRTFQFIMSTLEWEIHQERWRERASERERVRWQWYQR